jgi:ornithine cyclodeaminase/alanine dehydrogenase-like protein (mu-crystallin family)
MQQDLMDKDHIHAELGEIAAGHKPGRDNQKEITLFKSVGVAVQDVAAANRVLKAAQSQGLGTEVAL